MKSNLLGLFADEIVKELGTYGFEKYRGQQIAKWMYQQGVSDFNVMTNIPNAKREILIDNFEISRPTITAHQESADKKTSKYLLTFKDGAAVETVLMKQHYGNSVCVSTQVGCAMGCKFCASTLQGVTRNLTAGEIFSQVLHCNNQLMVEQSTVNTIVIMGSGEPLANYDNVLRFIRLCHESYSLNMSYRNITLSTAGIVPGIKRLAEEGIPINLAISLHAPTTEIRSSIMPINNQYDMLSVINAADHYAEKTGRRVTYEYTLIENINDNDEHASALAKLLKGRLASVNLIPVNPVPERGLLRPKKHRVVQFLQSLQAHHINATVRKEMGADIQAACGQLRKKVLEQEESACIK
ncbi:putative dual-specificity RNA methyltransferase RlmN [bioreactor metagenome]|uniref:Putative dual-specificity RNA methyltransferase RlmN n=1 Tax=bioreactor metagenome TaxID=1076179 RepID=A0A644T0P0_9ZZZZ|nr:23S rRNA (adenine(2503)-C(2))-methyltransferase RlmN [Negativicutes bacterium]